MGIQSSKQKPTKLISLGDELLVEVDAPDDFYAEKSSKFAEPVRGTFNRLQPLIMAVYDLFRKVPAESQPEQLEIEINIAIDSEGQPYIAKGGSDSHIGVRMIYKRSQNRR